MKDPRKAETVQDKFIWILEDPFYSRIHNGMVRVDDYENMYLDGNLHTTDLTDGMIDVLYKEWLAYNEAEHGFVPSGQVTDMLINF